MVVYPLTMAVTRPYSFIDPVHIMDADRMLQLLIALFIAFEFGCYVMIRQVVNAKEWLSACQSSRV